MLETAKQKETIQTLKQKIFLIYQYLIDQNDRENAEKVKQLAKKVKNQDYTIAFCGHFSAGKSSMINRVIGENLLPSSPIPTSANLVKVKSGEDYAKVFFKQEKPRVYLAPYDYELVKQYCKDGDKIEEIEISHSHSSLPANTIIMDTPGIDSADDAHRVATESAIHLADLIFYVMDYNHVQAELNFLFTKELTEAGKEVYLVINQIDKHNDEELSFFAFQKSVVDSFASWGVQPARIFYTSLKEKDNPLNEFPELKQFMADKLAVKEQFLVPSVLHSLQKLAADHISQTGKSLEESLGSETELLNELSEQEKAALLDTFQELTVNLDKLPSRTSEKERQFDHDTLQILNNAYLMPFQTRALAESYLESCQAEFKVGFLFSRQKTKDERDARMEQFYEDLLEKTKSELEWHLKEYMLKTLKKLSLDEGVLLDEAQKYSIPVTKDMLVKALKPGARLSGQYVLQYTEDVAAEIKKAAKNQLAPFKSKLLEALAAQAAKYTKQYEQEYFNLEKYVKALTEINNIKQTITMKEQALEKFFSSNEAIAEGDHPLFEIEEEEVEVVVPDTNNTISRVESSGMKPDEKTLERLVHAPESENMVQNQNRPREVSNRLALASEIISRLPGFKKLSVELAEKANRLKQRGFTVALFGAFSAGKSSFANALIGEKVLPVSPNPTTAAINKIKPVTAEHGHGTVLVKFKETEAMLDDVNRSLKAFDLHADTLQAAVDSIGRSITVKSQDSVFEKTHFSFLQAFNKGHETFIPLLGTTKKADIAEFQEFVAKEEKSCFVEWIELYFDCELTRKGITLVDTPGADSINARHTGVAFDYIKNSDAILFVTYYNHAFSKADREFLIQLGRVKEAFQLDKMFFIINAIDLAENTEEKEAVADYVKEQLTKYGIRNPHLYSLSSLMGLQEKTASVTAAGSGLASFEAGFYDFIANDLTEMAIAAAEKELERVSGLVDNLIRNSKADESVKRQKRRAIDEQKAQIQAIFAKQTPEYLQNRLQQEAQELVYYIKQRVFLRYGDFFNEAFNPSTLRDDGRNLKKALKAALDEFLASFGFDFAQELRATTVRLDRFADRLLSEYQVSLIRNLHEVSEDLSFSGFDKSRSEEIDFPLAFENLDEQLFAKAMSYFKNPKSFFEKNERKKMSDELYNVLNPLADQYLSIESERMNLQYAKAIANEFKRLLNQMNEEIDDFYFSLLSALDGGVSVAQLDEIQSGISKLI